MIGHFATSQAEKNHPINGMAIFCERHVHCHDFHDTINIVASPNQIMIPSMAYERDIAIAIESTHNYVRRLHIVHFVHFNCGCFPATATRF